VGRRLLLPLVVAAFFCTASGAHAAASLTPCGKTRGLLCGTVVVPLDRSGSVAGTIPLHVEELPSASRSPRGVMFLVAGGPGQGSAKSFDLGSASVAQQFQAIFPDYTLVAFDNRGTGASGLINCPAIQRTVPTSVAQAARLARDCADRIGPTRQFYATRDHAADIESVRTALGFGKIGLYGVSYGTKLALAYALAFPTSVARMVLDSVLPPDEPDPYDRDVVRELPGTLGAYCAGGRCRVATANYAADVVAVANRLETKPIKGKVLVAGGARRTRRMTGEDLISLVIDTDLNPGLAAALPAAVHAARAGYNRPLLRLFDLDLRTSTLTAPELSFGLNVATTCADGKFPWSPTTPPADRDAVLAASVAALPAGSFGPFGSWAARLGSAYYCDLWPSPSGNAPLGGGAYPNVPVLALSGGLDLRTPTASARAVVAQFPQGQLLVVPGVGHSVLTADLTNCTARAVHDWLVFGNPFRTTCPRVPDLVGFVNRLPSRAPGSASGTLAAVATTLHEAAATWLALLLSPLKSAAGVYAGKLTLAGASGFRLANYAVAPGVRVSGRVSARRAGLPLTFNGTLRVVGPAAGTLHVAGHALRGVLGGRRVSGRA
jgi:pimeloyl-ACP methyl ester carboxylesterase